MPSHLTPVQITDKNGKLTTVHKKTEAAPKRTRKIPAPKPDYSSAGRAAMLELGIDPTYSKTAVPTLTFLAEKAPKLLNAIKEQCAAGGTQEHIWKMTLSFRALFGSPQEWINQNNLDYLHAIHGMLPAAVAVCEIVHPRDARGRTADLIEKTYDFGQRFRGDPTLLGYAIVADKFIVEDDVDDVIFSMGHRMPEIIEILPELARRGKVDKETLEILLDSENKALLSGEL